MIAQQMAAEGVQRIALVTEDLARYADRSNLPAFVTLHDRKDMDAVQRELRDLPGCTVLIYDQTCAAEKRRRRKKKELVDPGKRMVINEAVCEGCGDCGIQSNCVSILPKETEFGRKRTIDQSSCNKDYSCVKGFCPSFVTVEGGTLKKSRADKTHTEDWGALPQPMIPACEQPYNILINGIGGTGVITVGALMGMAAHLEGKGASVLDMTGMSQKNGSVTSHVKIVQSPAQLRAQRIATGEADLVLGCDMLTTGAADAVSKMRPGRTLAVVNLHEQPPGTFAQDADWEYPVADVRALIEESVGGPDAADFVDATKLATGLMGDSIAANLFMLGYAWQRGRIPLTEAALLRAIEMNGVAVESNQKSFLWGRRAAVDAKRVELIATPAQAVVMQMPQGLDSILRKRIEFLTGYQDAAYAGLYQQFVEQVRDREATLGLPSKRLSIAVAKALAKLMAYKDEYEVARLYTDGRFVEQLKSQFEGDFTLKFNLAPPVFAKKDASGHLVKAEYGSWTWKAFKILARLKGLRGGPLDVFGRTAERRMERALIGQYRQVMADVLARLTLENYDTAVALAALPEKIRGFGHVKEKAVDAYHAEQARLLATFGGSHQHAA
jgi:indolepyruvate ferredoxin oxidoreductase